MGDWILTSEGWIQQFEGSVEIWIEPNEDPSETI